jgi:GLPGLI family protein
MKLKIVIFVLLLGLAFNFTNAQKALTEGTLVYNMSVETGSGEPKIADMFDGATTTIYLKGNKSRTELVSSLGREATIHDASKGTGVILKDYSGQRLMITLTAANWAQNNSKYEGIIFQNTAETKTIAGFNCKKAIAKLKNGESFTVYYTTEVSPVNKSYDAQFKTLPGLPVQYEMESGKMKLKFTLASINYNLVSASKFEIPTSGYRVLTYDETKQNPKK